MNRTTTSVAVAFFGLCSLFTATAQNNNVGIGTTNPEATAILEMKSSTQGVLVPRMTEAQRLLIGGGTPATGLLVYQTDVTPGFYYYSGTAWVSLSNMTETDPKVATTITNIVPKWDGTNLVDGLITDDGTHVGISSSSPSFDFQVGDFGAPGTAIDQSTGNITGTGGTEHWQSFITPYKGAITGISLYANGNRGIFSTTISIYEGTGTSGTLLGTMTQSINFSLWTNITLTNPVFLQSGLTYTFRIQTASTLGLIMRNGNPYPDGEYYSTYYGLNPNYDLAFKVAMSNPQNVMAYDLAAGKLGIGTNLPATELDVAGIITAIGGNSSNWNEAYGWGNHTLAQYLPETLASNTSIIQGSNTLSFTSNQVDGFSVDGTTLSVDAANNRVGIGTTTPSATLDVVGNIVVSGEIMQDAWVAPTLLNGWIDLGSGNETAGYYKDKTGTVHLKGMIKSGTAVVFVLPSGYKPSHNKIFATIADNALARIDVNSNGDVTMISGSSSLYLSLEGISFRP